MGRMVVFGNRGKMLVVMMLGTACAGQSVDRVSKEAIVGDWFQCTNAACSTIGDDGMRLRGDNVVQALDTTEGPIAPPVCVVVTVHQRPYQFDGQYISMDGQRVELHVDGDRMTMVDVPVISSGDPSPVLQDLHMVRASTYERASCP